MKFNSSNKKYSYHIISSKKSAQPPSLQTFKNFNSSIYILFAIFRSTIPQKKKIRQKRSTQFWYSPLVFRKRRVKSYHEGTIARSQPSESYSSREGRGRGKPLPVIRSPGLEQWLGKGSSDGPELGVTRLGGCLGVN